MNKFRTQYVILSIIFCLVIFYSTVFSQRIPQPEGLFYYHPAASVYGDEAAWINPSILGWYRASSYQFITDYNNQSYGKSWGTVVARQNFAIATRHIDNPDGRDFNEYVLSAGLALGDPLTAGLSYRYFKDGPDNYNKRHYWNISFTTRQGGPLTLAALFSNLNRGRVNGDRTETEMRYSLAYRPINDKYTFAVDALFSTGQKFKDAEFIYHLSVNPLKGIFVDGFLTSEKDFQVGVRLNFLKYFTGWKSNYNKHGDHSYTSTYIGSTSIRQQSIISEKKRGLTMRISGSPGENPPNPVIGNSETPFALYILNIYRAADDPTIKELVLSLNGLSLGFGQAQELREALKYFRQNGKQIYCHLTHPNNIGYYAASAANKIFIPPVSQLELVGLRAELTYYAGTLGKLGIKVDMLRIGKYKSGAEPFTQSAPSEETGESTNRILDDIYDQFVTAIAEGRNISPDSVINTINNGPFTSAEALDYNLVDGLSYQDNLFENILNPIPRISFNNYLKDTLINDGWPRKPVIALVVAEGEITENNGSANPLSRDENLTPRSMARSFDYVKNIPEVKGIVYRINSPGGMALAGEEIHHSVQKASQQKPLIISMSNVAASGGYYIAMPGQKLFANQGTITGSIGIYGGKADLSGLYDKIDLGNELYTRGKYAGMLSTTRPFTDFERQKYFDQLMAFYKHFLTLVVDNRGLKTDSVDNLSQGKIWTGREAVANGLIDEIGGVKQAIDYTAELAGLKDYRVEIYPKKRPFIILPKKGLFGSILNIFSGDDNPIESTVSTIIKIDNGDIYTRMPYDIDIE